MDPLLITLAAAALLVGATGTWSPCGLSMIETIGPTGHTGGLRTTLAASATFAPFALAGGVLTFGSLALLGSLLHGADGTIAYLAAAALAAAAAVAEARGLPIFPQVRRQLPVDWRRSVPMPLAAAGYGILLGLGFTTFILSYGVWALMGISLAIGEPLAGVVIGLGFGIGRVLPIVALAPVADQPAGERACEAMVMRTGFYRGARLGDALALVLVAAVLAGSASAEGARTVERKAADPSIAGSDLAFQRPNGSGVLRGGGEDRSLPGGNPALGGSYAAVTDAEGIAILDRETLAEIGRIGADGADAVAASRKFIAWRTRGRGRDVLRAASIRDPAGPGPARKLAKARAPAQLGGPALSGGTLVYAKAGAGKSRLIRARLRSRTRSSAAAPPGTEAVAGAVVAGEAAGGAEPAAPGTAAGPGPEGEPAPTPAAGRSPALRVSRRTIRASRTEGLGNPSLRRGRLAYVQTTRRHQRVRLAGLGGGKGRTVYRRRTGRGFVWSLALDRRQVLITLLKGGGSIQLLRARR